MPHGSFSHLLSTWGSGPEGRRVLRETPEGSRGVSFLWTVPQPHSPWLALLQGSWTLCPQCPCAVPGLLHSRVPLAAAEPSGQAG